jgi:proline racemase
MTLHDDSRTSDARAELSIGEDIAVGGAGPPAKIVGDIAWGGNWFFHSSRRSRRRGDYDRATPKRLPTSLRASIAALKTVRNRSPAPEEATIDHIELFGPPGDPGTTAAISSTLPRTYDRSPCGFRRARAARCILADGETNR